MKLGDGEDTEEERKRGISSMDVASPPVVLKGVGKEAELVTSAQFAHCHTSGDCCMQSYRGLGRWIHVCKLPLLWEWDAWNAG